MGPALLSPLLVPWAVLEEEDEDDEVGEGRPLGANKRPSHSRSASSRASSCGAGQKERRRWSAEPSTTQLIIIGASLHRATRPP